MAANKHEFRVTFPAVDANDVDLTNEDNFAVIDEVEFQEKPPVVVLLAWAGCRDKHLAKYSEIYEQRRFITIRHTFPTSVMFFNYGQLGPISKKVLDVIYEQKLEDNPIIFHIFSNGGCLVYCHIINYIHSTDKYSKLDIKGSIIDSAPGRKRVLNATKAFMATLRMNTVIKYMLGFCVMVYLFLAGIFGNFFLKKRSTDNPFFVHESMSEDKARWPQLFFFSRSDRVVLHEDIQEVVDHRKKLGVDVWSVCWDDSDHVAHFRAHREAYIQKCREFTSFCLKPAPILSQGMSKL